MQYVLSMYMWIVILENMNCSIWDNNYVYNDTCETLFKLKIIYYSFDTKYYEKDYGYLSHIAKEIMVIG